jgi:hypothetical protein
MREGKRIHTRIMQDDHLRERERRLHTHGQLGVVQRGGDGAEVRAQVLGAL